MNDERFPPERAQLEAGWEWLKRNGPEHPDHSDFYDRWLEKLHEYERLYGMEYGEEPKEALFGDGLVAAVKAGRKDKDSPFSNRWGR